MMMLDKLAYSSPLRYKSTTLKAAFAIAVLLFCVAIRSFVIGGVVLILMGALTVIYSKVSFPGYLKLMMVPLTFLILGTVAVAVDLSAEPVGFVNLAAGSKYLVVTKGSLLYAFRLIVVSLSAVSCLYFLILTTTMLELIGLLRKLHCPWLVLELMMLIYRFIFVLLDTAAAVTTAQKCRLGNRTMGSSINSMGQMLASLFVIAMGRSSNLFSAMEARCYDGRIRTLQESEPLRPRDFILLAGYLSGLSAVAFFLRAGVL